MADTVLVALARLEEKVDRLRDERLEDREYMRRISQRVGGLETTRAQIMGWAAGAAAIVAAVVGPLSAWLLRIADK